MEQVLKYYGPIKIGDNVKIGAGAVVLKSTENNVTVVGVPKSRVIRRFSRWKIYWLYNKKVLLYRK